MQHEVYKSTERFIVLVCGRRWGKSTLAMTLLIEHCVNKKHCSYLAPSYDDFIKPFYNELFNSCWHLLDLKSCRKGKFMKFKSGGTIDFYSSNSIDAGRGRRFHLAIIDEAGHSSTVGYLQALFELALRPTLVDYRGRAVLMGTPTGNKNFFYQLTTRSDWAYYHAPTSSNPLMSEDELNSIMLSNNALVWSQEYLAEFVDWDENSFFNWNHFKITDDNISYQKVYITVDTAVKGGKNHDGTAYCVWGVNTRVEGVSLVIDSIVLLDWDIFNLDGNMLEEKLIPIINNLKQNHDLTGVFVEDKGSGTIVIQNLKEKYGGLIRPLGERYLGHKSKGDRAVACSPFTSAIDPQKRKVHISNYANEKKVMFKNQFKNHLKDQISTFSISSLAQADDLVDAFCYGVLAAFYKKN